MLTFHSELLGYEFQLGQSVMNLRWQLATSAHEVNGTQKGLLKFHVISLGVCQR